MWGKPLDVQSWRHIEVWSVFGFCLGCISKGHALLTSVELKFQNVSLAFDVKATEASTSLYDSWLSAWIKISINCMNFQYYQIYFKCLSPCLKQLVSTEKEKMILHGALAIARQVFGLHCCLLDCHSITKKWAFFHNKLKKRKLMLEIFHIVDNVFSVLMQDLYLTIWSALRQSLLWFGALLIVHN